MIAVRDNPSDLLIVLSVFCYLSGLGSTVLAYKISFESFPPFMLAAIRFLVGGGVLLVWGWLRAPGTRPSREQWKAAVFAGAVLFSSATARWSGLRHVFPLESVA